MFEHFLLRPIFDSAKGPVARLLISPVIGAAAIYLMLLMKHDQPVPGELWHWLAGGAGVGLLAGLIMTCVDLTRAVSPERRRARARLAEAIMQHGHAADSEDALDQADAVLREADEHRASKVGWAIAAAVLFFGLVMLGILLVAT
ncbi:MAG TPA: hypothetical protein VGR35_06615 [Tepidisphaeraceae bacterium]|nr:hypothetical protein [Tepidisphaeraceae bacterium]